MKIALLLSGQPNFYLAGYECLRDNILNNNDVDVFFHVWEDEKDQEQSYICKHCDTKNVIRESTKQKLVELYRPKKYYSEPQKPSFNNKFEFDKYPISNGENLAFITFSMFYSMHKSMSLLKEYELENNIVYDIIVKGRFDNGLLSKIDFKDYVDFDKCVYSADVCRNPAVMSDWLFWSSGKNMKDLIDCYDEIDEYIFKENVFLCGEEIILHKLKKMNATITKLPISLFLIRDKYIQDRRYGKEFK